MPSRQKTRSLVFETWGKTRQIMTKNVNHNRLSTYYTNTYKVLDAKFVSSCFNCPSKAKPHLSLLLANRGVKTKTLLTVKPGPIGHPSLQKNLHDKFNIATEWTLVIEFHFKFMRFQNNFVRKDSIMFSFLILFFFLSKRFVSTIYFSK